MCKREIVCITPSCVIAYFSYVRNGCNYLRWLKRIDLFYREIVHACKLVCHQTRLNWIFLLIKTHEFHNLLRSKLVHMGVAIKRLLM